MTTPLEDQFDAHRREHELEGEALEKALATERVQAADHAEAHQYSHEAHTDKHKAEGESVKTALAAVERERSVHAIAHDREHTGHALTHQQEQLAVKTALDAVGRERDIHAAAHEKEHHAHLREHELNTLAITKAEKASDDRFHAVNEFRSQLSDVIGTLASKEAVEALAKDNERRWDEIRKDLDRRFADASKQTQERYEANRASIIAIEKGDVKQEGKGLGQTWVFAGIVTVISVVGAVLGIVVVLANLATKA